ncbi:hypothetical protein [Gymnodinialimonas sp. 57CJ19]|uniref:hypothetical protein n=1 Tax=Gymnodinialimonas sp. 57CJ19 TaxID=3138498 RepID=UPI0031342433
MLVIVALSAYFLGQLASVGTLFLAALFAGLSRHPVAIVPLSLAGLWIFGTVDFSNYADGPMRIDAEMNLVGAGAGLPPLLSNGSDGPAWWIAALSALTFAAFVFWPKLPHLRTAAVIGLVSLAVTYGGFAALGAMY